MKRLIIIDIKDRLKDTYAMNYEKRKTAIESLNNVCDTINISKDEFYKYVAVAKSKYDNLKKKVDVKQRNVVKNHLVAPKIVSNIS